MGLNEKLLHGKGNNKIKRQPSEWEKKHNRQTKQLTKD